MPGTTLFQVRIGGARVASLLLVSCALAAPVGCANGTLDPNATHEPEPEPDPDEPEPEPVDVPAEVRLAVDDQGAYTAGELGFTGAYTSEAGPGSSIELRFEAGDLCLSGTTALVPEGEQAAYWGARATFNLCENSDGEALSVSECLEPAVLREFVGVAFNIEGEVLPRRIRVEFIEAGRAEPAFLVLQTSGEFLALFERVTDPFNASSAPVNPRQLKALSVRAVGANDAERPFDFCVTGLRALFGDAWEAALIPDWLDEAGPGQLVGHVGANLVGAEFGEQNLPGEYGSDYIYPSALDIGLFTSLGMDTFRVPFRWERIQRELYGALDANELQRLKDVVSEARGQQATVIIDPHNFARYEESTASGLQTRVVGVDIDVDAFADFWSRLAQEFAGEELVWFGLMNEPHSMQTEVWLGAANAAIAAIRAAGASNKVLVPGNQWTGAHAWFADYYGTPNSEVLTGVVDPADNFAFELHQYFDAGSSGTSNTCVGESIGVERVQAVTEWLREQGFQGFMGEFGGSDDPVCLGATDQLLTHLGENADVWLGWTIWASSEWNIQHNVRPQNGRDPLQLEVLYRHMD